MTRNNKLSPEHALAILEAVIKDAPKFNLKEALTENQMRWLGRADAILEASGASMALINFRTARHAIGSYSFSMNDLIIPLHEAYSKIELMVPSSSQGAFIPSGDTWNGYAALIKVIQSDCDNLLIVDPYINSTIYTDFSPHSTARNGVRFLTAKRNENHLGLLAASQKWASDQISKAHPVEGRYAPVSTLHDRLIIIDSKIVWLVSQSFKDIAKRSPASVSRADTELSAMKSQHYETLWASSDPLA